jgi:hypothetical protein
MGRFSLIGSSYRSQSVLADCQLTMNWYEETIESGVGKSAKALYPTPGLKLIYSIGVAGARGITTFQGRTFCVAGASLYELLGPNADPNTKNWTQTLGVPIPSDGNPVSLAGAGKQLLIISSGKSFVFDLSANSLTAVDPSAGAAAPIVQATTADTFFFSLVKNNFPALWQINASNSFDATTWQGTNFTDVTVFQDNPSAFFRTQRNLWVFSPTCIQPYTDTGDFPFPFDVIPGTLIEEGLAAQNSIDVFEDGSLIWLAASKRGTGIVRMTQGFSPIRVSNHALEYALQGYATVSDAVGYVYQDQGHSFYVLQFPTANATWIFDRATRQWHQRGFWNPNKLPAQFDRHRAACHTFNYGMHLVGDYATGSVYQQSINFFTDFGNPIRRVRRAPHISKEQRRIRHNRIQIDAEVGIGPNLTTELPPTFIVLNDINGDPWTVSVSDQGQLVAQQGGTEFPRTLYFTDPVTKTNWELIVTPIGQLQAVSTTFNFDNLEALPMVSVSGQFTFIVTIKQVGVGDGQIQVNNQSGNPGGQRGPLWTLRWSDDGGQSWSNEHARDGGMIGQFLQRLIWNRLGMPRDRVYELSTSDAFPARVIEAYLDADDYQPSERNAKQAAKTA